jgi:HK97 family phage prohead protease
MTGVENAAIDAAQRRAEQDMDRVVSVEEARKAFHSLKIRRGFPFQVRAIGDKEDDVWRLEGHAAVFDQVTKVFSWDEVIRRGAFTKTLAETDLEKVALYNHDWARTLGRESEGTLELREDETGLWNGISLDPRITDHKDTFLRVQRGDVKGESFGFNILKEAWTEAEARGEGFSRPLLEILEVRLVEVSPTPFPAYTATDVEVKAVRAAFCSIETTAQDSTSLKEAAGEGHAKETTAEPDAREADHSEAGAWKIRLQRRQLQLTALEG